MQVEFGVEKSTFHLLVDGVRVADGHLPNDEGSSLDLHNLVYLGGDPGGHTKVCVQYHNSPHSRTVEASTCSSDENAFLLRSSSGTQHSWEQRHRMYQEFQRERGSFVGTQSEPQNSALLQHTRGDRHLLHLHTVHHLWFGNISYSRRM